MTQPRGQKVEASIHVEIGPTPNHCPLEFQIECRLSQSASRGTKHSVTIHPDWSVTTPHDLDSERVAAAFGGYTSCLPLVEQTIPAFRAMLPVLSRQSRIPLWRDSWDDWLLPASWHVPSCCRGQKFTSAAAAARHVRSASHIAGAYNAPRWQVSAVMSAAEDAWGSWEENPPHGVQLDRLVREIEGVAELWRAGLRPDEVLRLAIAASVVKEPLPVSYFLGMVYGEADPDWVSEVLLHRPDADTAAWLSWLDAPDRIASSNEWGAWLRFGLPKNDVRKALEAGLRSDQVLMVSRDTGWSSRVTARNLVAWAKVGCFPTVGQFKALRHHGVEDAQPSGGAIDALVNEVRSLNKHGVATPDRTGLAVLLVVLGTRRAVVRALVTRDYSLGHINSPAHSIDERPHDLPQSERIA